MIAAPNPVTPLGRNGPRRPIVCSLCGARLGAWYQYRFTFYPYLRQCSDRCERLLDFANARHHVPAHWRDYPDEWRAPLLASAMIEERVNE